jgi:gluconate:H+ symporter, GntP family
MTALAAEAITDAGTGQLILAAVLGIAVVVLLIVWAKWHPFIALIMGAGTIGIVAGAAPGATIKSFTTGVGATVGSVGLLIALGSMIGALLA